MYSIDETAMRILATLEEAGEDDAVDLINTVNATSGAPGELKQFVMALEQLIRGGLVRMSTDKEKSGTLRPLSVDESLTALEAISSYTQYDSKASAWFDTRRTAPPYSGRFPYVLTTDVGLPIAQELLKTRGWQWWKRRI